VSVGSQFYIEQEWDAADAALDHAARRAGRSRQAALIALIACALACAGVLAATSLRASDVRHAVAPPAARPVAPPIARTAPSPARLDAAVTYPFRPPAGLRAARPGEVPSMYATGVPCAVGCRPAGAVDGWPLKPFFAQHPLRAGLNELRPGSLHVGLDIQARDGQAVYAVQPGTARVLAASGPDARVEVGNYVYWHIVPSVRDGQLVVPHETVLGRVMRGYGHIAFSEVDARGDYVNPLRPGGRVLTPWVDRAAPVIGRPAVDARGDVVVGAFDRQTLVRRTTYLTPVLAPASLAYRVYDASGRAVTPLEWALRGTRLEPFSLRALIYAPGARQPGYACFATRAICRPRWVYRLAGGFAPALPTALPPGRYRLTAYAWDWADNVSALDTTLTLRDGRWVPRGHVPPGLIAPVPAQPAPAVRGPAPAPVATPTAPRAVAPAASTVSPETYEAPATSAPPAAGTPEVTAPAAPVGGAAPVGPSTGGAGAP